MALSPFSATWRNDVAKLFASIQTSLTTFVVGPATATDHAIARYDLTTGKLLQNSVVTVGDTGAIAGAISLAMSGVADLNSTALTLSKRTIHNGPLNLGTTNILTIAAGVITISSSASSNILVDTQGGAATDDLDTISGGQDGDIVLLRSLSAARDTTIKNGTGNILTATGADYVLATATACIMLINFGGNNWREISRS